MNAQIANLVGASPIALSNREPEWVKLLQYDDELLWFFNPSINISSSL
jgi:hypothetical protein